MTHARVRISRTRMIPAPRIPSASTSIRPRFLKLVLSAGLVLGVGLISGARGGAPEQGPRELSAITTGWRFQIDARDMGERERWYASGFDRSGWSSRGGASRLGLLRPGAARL